MNNTSDDTPLIRDDERKASRDSWSRRLKRFFRRAGSTSDVFTRIYTGIDIVPDPVALLDEECPHQDGAYRDKMLGLWRLPDLQI